MKLYSVGLNIIRPRLKYLALTFFVLLATLLLHQDNAMALSVNYNSSTNTISGVASPSQLVSLSVTGLPLGTVTANSSGVFSYTLSAAQISALGTSCGKKVSATTNDSLKYFTGVYLGANINYTDLSSPSPSIQYLGGGSGSYPATHGSNSIGFDASERYAYIPTNGMGVEIVDTQTSVPTVVGNIAGNRAYTSSDGKVLYISTSSNLMAYDISTPTLALSPALLSSGPSPAITWFSAGQVGSFSPTVDLLVGTDTSYTNVNIVSFDRTTNTFTNQSTISGVTASYAAGTDIGYSADVSIIIVPNSTRDVLRVYNLSNPSAPALVGSLSMPSGEKITSLDLSNAGDFAILSTDNGNGAYKVILTNPSAPTIDSSWIPGAPAVNTSALNTSISPTGQYVALNGTIAGSDQFAIKDTVTGVTIFTGNMGSNATAEWGGWSGNYKQSVVAYDQTGNCSSKLSIEKSKIGRVTDYGSGEYGVTFKFSLENNGNVDLTDISAKDDLVSILGASNIVSVSAPIIITAPASGSTVNLNSAYNGNSDQELLVLPNNLLIGHKIEFSINVRFKSGATSFPVTNHLEVSATAFNVAAILSGDMEEPLDLPRNTITVNKTIDGDIISLDNNYYQAVFVFDIKNTGDYDLASVSVDDDLTNVFGSNANFSIESLTLLSAPASGSNITINSSYDGKSNPSMTDSSASNLLIGHEAKLRLVVKFDGSKSPATMTNIASASAQGTAKADVLGDLDVAFNVTNTPVDSDSSSLPSTGDLSLVVKILSTLSAISLVVFLKREWI